MFLRAHHAADTCAQSSDAMWHAAVRVDAVLARAGIDRPAPPLGECNNSSHRPYRQKSPVIE